LASFFWNLSTKLIYLIFFPKTIINKNIKANPIYDKATIFLI